MTIVIKDNGNRRLAFDQARLERFIDSLFVGIEDDITDEFKEEFKNKSIRQVKALDEIDFVSINSILTENAKELIAEIRTEDGENVDLELLGNTKFDVVAKRILLNSLYKRASRNRAYDRTNKYGDLYGLVKALGEKGLYDKRILSDYSREELIEASKFIVPERDELLSYGGLYHLSNRYMIRDKDETRSVYELPQERYLNIALAIHREEPIANRLTHVKELYDVLSTQKATMATPTFTNAARPDAQLSSCFIITTEDSLEGIYNDNTTAAKLSKHGGGLGIYYGFVRAAGSSIRGNKNVSGGVVPWIRQLNNTAVSVDQLGQRKGALAVYLDVWHADISNFLELRLNTGEITQRAHEIFTGVTIPDEFMRQVNSRGDWHLFDPYEVKQEMGYYLQDFYDKEKMKAGDTPDIDKNAWTYHYYQCVDNPNLKKTRVPAIEIMKKIMVAQLESGVPFMFHRDTVNRDNPNNHEGMIYSSNLCSEISQNMSATTVTEESYTPDGKIVTSRQSGDLVTCNLASLVLNNIFSFERGLTDKDIKELGRVIKIVTRALDNVISINNLPVAEAQITNSRYRAIGLGQQGIAATLANKSIMFDSEEAINFIDELEEIRMAFTIKASAELGLEKGSYPLYKGSQWNTGQWIARKPIQTEGFVGDLWKEVIDLSKRAMRNGYLTAPAPTGSTSILAGSTAAVENAFDIIHFDGKKDTLIPIVVPNLNVKTYFYYKPTMKMDYNGETDLAHMWFILQNAKRQVWTDQSISANIYVPNDVRASNLLELLLQNWDRGVKTSYYVRSHGTIDDACFSCSA